MARSLASGRQTLFHIAADAGFHTAAVMPQITLDWPEATLMGFETVLAAADLGYAGLPFNWVTMPDQFTFAALDRLLRDGGDKRPLFAQVATGSSHAPWVPVPEIVDWDAIGDGRIFNEMAAAGDPPDVVWRDRDRVRDQYRQAIDYALARRGRLRRPPRRRPAADPSLLATIRQRGSWPSTSARMCRCMSSGPRRWSPRRLTGGGKRGLSPAWASRPAPWRRCGI
jgi:hypothetical protein